jgi:hypothetical protein
LQDFESLRFFWGADLSASLLCPDPTADPDNASAYETADNCALHSLPDSEQVQPGANNLEAIKLGENGKEWAQNASRVADNRGSHPYSRK